MIRVPPEFVDIQGQCEIAPTVLFLCTDRSRIQHIIIGSGTTIRDHTVIYEGATIGQGCTIDHHVIIREQASIGRNVRIMNYTEVGQQVVIEEHCRIAGYLCNRAHVGAHSSCFGHLVHRYPTHGGGVLEDAPRIGSGVIVGRLAVIAGGVTIEDGVRVRAGEVLS